MVFRLLLAFREAAFVRVMLLLNAFGEVPAGGRDLWMVLDCLLPTGKRALMAVLILVSDRDAFSVAELVSVPDAPEPFYACRLA